MAPSSRYRLFCIWATYAVAAPTKGSSSNPQGLSELIALAIS
ncbi:MULTISPECIES: hypothetical protein [unclassified Coleofasciculus]|nr:MULTISPECIES: hypothetical protein [unclassified Coleofasciculus]